MKRVGHIVLPLLMLMVFIGSCKKEEDPGFAIRDDYLGYWQCDEYDANQLLISTFQVEIIAHPTNENRVFIDNFTNLGQGFQAEAEIDNTSIVILQQLVSGAAVSGTGFIDKGHTRLEMQYTFDDGSGQPENISATCAKI